ncbi:Crp/Fnr family transcriptional regulator [Thalassotalea euphylliae]|uniref:Crp/Fnr family transcriptional regulator n=1 Tax=Thalassotalea euphylliae TaxID=1655234 RepID=A0A3E0TNC2_9GAMM|nr:Crp/Fnr family transcriptional regulator [Thalassotalea euphylliae]REL25612.1 Crp/Fnr family transcriptional regulator [Thalassotalea euphylliae]
MHNLHDLKTLLSPLLSLDDSLWQAWSTIVKPVSVAAGERLLHAGKQQTHFYIIKTGVVRFFYTLPDGKERNKAFFKEGDPIGSMSAYLTGSASSFCIETLAPCELYKIAVEDFNQLIAQYPPINDFLDNLTKQLFIRNERREGILLTGNAEARYQWLMDEEPWLLARQIPQYHIASYLSMDAVSLSRLKRKKC